MSGGPYTSPSMACTTVRREDLVIVKDKGSAFLYISSLANGPKHIWKRFCRRGNHESKHGVASTMGIKSLLSNGLFQVEGHILSCFCLNLILKKLCRELSLWRSGRRDAQEHLHEGMQLKVGERRKGDERPHRRERGAAQEAGEQAHHRMEPRNNQVHLPSRRNAPATINGP